MRLLVPVLMYGSETMIWMEDERSRIRAVQMDKIRSFLGIRRVDRVPNARIREMCGMEKGGDEWIEEDVFPCIPPILDHSPCLPDIQTSFL